VTVIFCCHDNPVTMEILPYIETKDAALSDRFYTVWHTTKQNKIDV